MLRKLGMILILLILGIFGITLYRTTTFTSRQLQVSKASFESFDLNEHALILSKAVQFATDTNQKKLNEQQMAETWNAFHQFLRQSFPLAHQKLTVQPIVNYSLLYHWPGKVKACKPNLLMGHMDTVPAAKSTIKKWDAPPFSGKIKNGFIYGRGTLDDKVSVIAILDAIEYLISKNKRPRCDLYLFFGHDEETHSTGAIAASDWFKKNKIRLGMTIDEGMVITRKMLPGVEDDVALIGIAEKGYATVKLETSEQGGHSSMPPAVADSSVVKLSQAILAITNSPFPANLNPVLEQMFAYTGPEMSYGMKIAIANLWLTKPIIMSTLTGQPNSNALVRTTLAATMLNASERENVLPKKSNAWLNLRFAPGHDPQDALNYLKQIAGPNVELTWAGRNTPASSISSADNKNFQIIAKAIRQTFDKTIVAPGLVVGYTDSQYFHSISEDVYKFLPLVLTKDDTKRIHGINERVSLENYGNILRYYRQLIMAF